MRGLYRRLAWSGIAKNRKFYLPYLLTCIGMTTMYYIIAFLTDNEILLSFRGGEIMQTILMLGTFVIAVFALIFLFYTNSFLIRRRKREFGLYNILGMGKRHLACVVIWEAVFLAGISLAAGLLLGILLSKTAELGMVRLVSAQTDYRLRIEVPAIRETLAIFGVIHLLILLNSLRQIHLTNPLELLRSESAGEKPPKANWVLALLGAVLLGGAYALAVSIEEPISALLWFFVAVIMVILGTYLLFIAGSVALCRLLQKNKRYYYKTNHFVSVSSMLYRMKRNGAGLASVCIIATMILVMISSSSCLYFGAEDSANMRYPRDINITLAGETPEQITDGNIERYRRAIADYTSERGVPPKDVQNYRYINTSGLFSGDTVQCWYSREGVSASYSELRDIYIVSTADYAARTGENVSLAPDEVLLLTYKCSYERPTLTLAMDDVSHTWRVADVRNGYFLPPTVGGFIAQMTLIVNDTASAVQDFRTYNGHVVTMQYKWVYNFNTDLGDEECVALTQGVMRTLGEVEPEQGYMYLLAECRAEGSADFYGSNGALFFIGIMLTLVFMLAAVLILYYKQISEGYEDQKRFEIMQKVGMTKKEIRRSINSQLLTVFFLPLLLAGVHLAFAFPMIRRLLELFSLYNVGLFVTTTLVSFGAFALLYTIVYRLTAKAYYNIVSA